jgi:hypothetical protein
MDCPNSKNMPKKGLRPSRIKSLGFAILKKCVLICSIGNGGRGVGNLIKVQVNDG